MGNNSSKKSGLVVPNVNSSTEPVDDIKKDPGPDSNTKVESKDLFPPPVAAVAKIHEDMYNQMIPITKHLHISNVESLRSPFMEFLFLDQLDAFKQFGKGDITLAFHGTNSKNLNSISDLGFLDPYSPNYHVVNGNAYGKGIYVTTDVNYAANYAKNALIVVAVLEGYSTTDVRDFEITESNSKRPPVKGMVVLEAKSQVLPLFVLELRGRKKISLENIPFANVKLFDFTSQLIGFLPRAQEISQKHEVSVGLALHLCYRAHQMDDVDPDEWIEDYCTSFNLQDMELSSKRS